MENDWPEVLASVRIDPREAAMLLQTASNSGRSIIPLLGAGISIESGIPALSELTQYLAKVNGYIRRGLYRPRVGGESTYSSHPDQFIRDFGWPDYYQLNSDLWHLVDKRDPRLELPGDVPYRDSLLHFTEDELLENLSHLDEGLVRHLKAIQRTKRLQLRGNYWKSLLGYLTRSNPDHVDTLFQTLVRGRQPGLAHRYFAFLSPILSLRLFLTLNFDDLLEQALQAEGLLPTVYDVSHDSSSLPDPALLEERLSIIKLHGGAFGLLVGEKLDAPLDEESKTRLGQYIPDNAVVLVMGLGGWDLRVLDLVKHVADRTQILWLHFEEKGPASPVRDVARQFRSRDRICLARVRHPGSFLVDVHGLMTGSHPVGRRAYRYLDHQPIPMFVQGEEPPDMADPDRPIVVFWDRERDDGFGASLALARFVASRAETHRPIWIDLEAMYTVADVVVEVFRQLRQYDPSLPPVVLPDAPAVDADSSSEADGVNRGKHAKAIRRIFDALRRGRYILAFNAVGSFGRPPTFHHGLSEADEEGESSPARQRTHFLEALVYAAHREKECQTRQEFGPNFRDQHGYLRDSILAFAVDRIRRRRGGPDAELYPEFLETVRSYESRLLADVPAESPPVTEVPPELHDALLLISTFRRRRSIAAMHRLLPMFPPESWGKNLESRDLAASIKHLLDTFEECGYVVRVEGGNYWMPRRLRDRIYSGFSGLAGSRKIFSLLASENQEELKNVVLQLSDLSFVHDALADYHLDLFLASRDSGSLFEHLYHRISGARYLTKLDAVLAASKVEQQVGPRLQSLFRESAASARHQVRELRLSRIIALQGVLTEHREVMRSLAPSGALVQWLKWVADQDVRRLRLEECLTGHTLPDREEEGELAALEIQICESVDELSEDLEDFKCSVLRDRFEFGECLRLRARTIFRSLGIEHDPQGPSREQIHALWDDDNVERLAGSVSEERWCRLVDAVMDIWTCLRWSGDGNARKARELASILISKWEAHVGPWDRDLLIRKVRWHRQVAEYELSPMGPWEMKGVSIEVYKGWQDRCREAIHVCQDGMKLLPWVAAGDRARARSYFHSLQGRAHYLLGQFHESHRQLDLAGMGLNSQESGDREMHAIRLLRLAECLTVRADDVIMRSVIEAEAGRNGDLSPEGRLLWVMPAVGGLCQSENPRLRRAARLSIAQLAYSDSPLLKVGEDWLLRRLKPAEVEEWTSWKQSYNVRRFQAEVIKYTKATTSEIRSRSLVYWPIEKLSEGYRPEMALGRARGRLLRARDVLDEAASYMEGARRSAEWWLCLYQLRAKLQVERLLLLLTGDQLKKGGHVGSHHVALFTGCLQEGLRSVRQGLDLVLPAQARNQEALQKDKRVLRLLRIWVELAIGGFFLTRLTGDRGRKVEAERLWESWKEMNSLARLFRLPESALLMQLIRVLQVPRQHGIKARALAFASLHQMLHAGVLEELVSSLDLPSMESAGPRALAGDGD